MEQNQNRLLLICFAYSQFAVAFGETQCNRALHFTSSKAQREVWGLLGSRVELNCSALLGYNTSESGCEVSVQWIKEGQSLTNLSASTQVIKQEFAGNFQLAISSVLTVNLKDQADFGSYSCQIWNCTINFILQSPGSPSHTGAVVASVVLFLILVLAGFVYSKCHLNFKLWYKNTYGDYEINDGKMYDAYISYINSENDRKFVNFILKPHLENKYGHKLLINDTNILPGAEPSAELLMDISRCRRLIVVLSEVYLEQEWCTTNFRQGLLHLLELSHKPIFIIFQSQQKHVGLDIIQHLRVHQACITTLVWGPRSIMPVSRFWKELALVMPRRMGFHSESVGDPQTLLEGDKDPILTTMPDYLDCRPDPDPAGDLGLRLPLYKAMSSRAPVLPAAPNPTVEAKAPEIDVSDLGSRNYAARTDFYCLVTEDDI